MNNVCIDIEPQPFLPQQGDIFVTTGNDDGGAPYILSSYGRQYAAISLENGMYWKDPTTNVNEAIIGLKFVGRNRTIVIK